MIFSLASNPISLAPRPDFSLVLVGIIPFLMAIFLLVSSNSVAGGIKSHSVRKAITISTIIIGIGSLGLVTFGLTTNVSENLTRTTNNEKALISWADSQYGIKLNAAQAETLNSSDAPSQITDSHGKKILAQLQPVLNKNNAYILYSVGQPTPLNRK